MSRRYEFLEETAEIIEGDELLDTFGDDILIDPADGEYVALVLGNPWATAGVLLGDRTSIAQTLRSWLAIVEQATS
jgi:hypothetical protein